MRIDIIPKYNETHNLIESLSGNLNMTSKIILDDFSLITGEISYTDKEQAVHNLEHLITSKIAGKAYAVIVTSKKRFDEIIPGQLKYGRTIQELTSNVKYLELPLVNRVIMLDNPAPQPLFTDGKFKYLSISKKEGEKKQNFYLLQRIEPGGISSQHVHSPDLQNPDITLAAEYHIGLFGVAEEMTDKGKLSIHNGVISRKAPGEAHMIRNAIEIPCLTLIVGSPAGKGRNDRRMTTHLKWN